MGGKSGKTQQARTLAWALEGNDRRGNSKVRPLCIIRRPLRSAWMPAVDGIYVGESKSSERTRCS